MERSVGYTAWVKNRVPKLRLVFHFWAILSPCESEP